MPISFLCNEMTKFQKMNTSKEEIKICNQKNYPKTQRFVIIFIFPSFSQEMRLKRFIIIEKQQIPF